MKTIPKSGSSKGGAKNNPSTGGIDFAGLPRIEAVRRLLVKAGKEIESGRFSVSDYIRLMQLEKELEAEEPPREIQVTWIDPVEAPGSGE